MKFAFVFVAILMLSYGLLGMYWPGGSAIWLHISGIGFQAKTLVSMAAALISALWITD